MSNFVSRPFTRRHQVSPDLAQRLAPGQYIEQGFPVLSYSQTPRIVPDEWPFRIEGMVGRERTWSMEEFRVLPFEEIPCDIHCVTKWSKLSTSFRGVSVDVLLDEAEPKGRGASRLRDGPGIPAASTPTSRQRSSRPAPPASSAARTGSSRRPATC
jgi:DMSO/TMAO reductase YedYZ molybdopterin-dependent catalytic subunit